MFQIDEVYGRAVRGEVRTDPFSLESLIAWLEKQPAETEYAWYDCCGCLMYKYFRATVGPRYEPGDGRTEWLHLGAYHEMHRMFRDNQYHDIGRTQPWTFGAALERAREALSDHRE